MRATDIIISNALLKEKALEIAQELGDTNFTASDGYISRFKERHGITLKVISGEEKSVTPAMTEAWTHHTLPELLAQYEHKDIFNADETGLFYKLLPNKTLAFKGERCSGGKQSKDRITVHVGASMLGEKLPLLCIGK